MADDVSQEQRTPGIIPQSDPEQALRESEDRFRAFVTASSDAVYRMSPDWSEMRYLDGRGFLADTREPSRSWLETYIDPGDQATVMEAIAQAIRDKRMFELEHRVLRADGHLGWTLSRAVPMLDHHGDIVEWLGAAKDITERKEREEWNQDNEVRQSFLLALSDALRPLASAHAITETACRLLVEHLEASRAQYNEVEGAPGSEIGIVRGEYTGSGQPMTRRFPLAAFGTSLVSLLRDGETLVLHDTETDPRIDDAQRRTFRQVESPAAISAPLVKDGRLVASFTVHNRTPRDWTAAEIDLVEQVAERTWSAVERARAEESLRQSEERLQLALDASEAGAYVWDPREDRADADSRMLELFGRPGVGTISLKEVLGSIVHPDDRARYGAAVARALDPAGSGMLAEDFRVVHPDSSVHWLSIFGRVTFEGEPRQATRMAGLMMAITDRKRAEEERERLLAEVELQRNLAEEAVRTRDEFLSIAAHELRNPVTTIKATGQLMERSLARGRLDPEREERYVRTITETADHLRVLIDDLLDVSRLRSGQLAIHSRPSDLARVVLEAVEVENLSVAWPRLRLDVTDGHTMSLDPERIRQVVINLLDNAIKYSPEGGEVHVTLEYDANGALLRVTDRGIGMPPDALEAIFEPFGRASNAALSRIQGMGLGLYIARRIVEAHGGRLWAESDGEGRGTTMTMWLPASRNET